MAHIRQRYINSKKLEIVNASLESDEELIGIDLTCKSHLMIHSDKGVQYPLMNLDPSGNIMIAYRAYPQRQLQG